MWIRKHFFSFAYLFPFFFVLFFHFNFDAFGAIVFRTPIVVALDVIADVDGAVAG